MIIKFSDTGHDLVFVEIDNSTFELVNRKLNRKMLCQNCGDEYYVTEEELEAQAFIFTEKEEKIMMGYEYEEHEISCAKAMLDNLI